MTTRAMPTAASRDLLDARREVQDVGHRFCVLAAARGEDRDQPELADVHVHQFLEVIDLVRELRLGEEDGGVREVHHQL